MCGVNELPLMNRSVKDILLRSFCVFFVVVVVSFFASAKMRLTG